MRKTRDKARVARELGTQPAPSPHTDESRRDAADPLGLAKRNQNHGRSLSAGDWMPRADGTRRPDAARYYTAKPWTGRVADHEMGVDPASTLSRADRLRGAAKDAADRKAKWTGAEHALARVAQAHAEGALDIPLAAIKAECDRLIKAGSTVAEVIAAEL